MEYFEFIEYPFTEEQILSSYTRKVADRRIHVLLCITVHELTVKDLVKEMVSNGFDGALVSGINNDDDIEYVKTLKRYLHSLPLPYKNFNWDVIITLNTGLDIDARELEDDVLGVVSNGKYKSFRNPRVLNNIDYHSTRLYNIKNMIGTGENDIDTILRYYTECSN
jgi:hypothetical protein